MVRFYLSYLPEAIRLLFSGWSRWATAIGIALTLFSGINQPVGKLIADTYSGFSPLFALIPVGILVAYGLLHANYVRFQALRNRLDAVEQQAHFRAQDTRVGISNRDTLVGSIAEVVATAKALLISRRVLSRVGTISPYIVNTEEMQEEQQACDAFSTAKQSLDREKLVAGFPFREPVEDFTICILKQFEETRDFAPEDGAGLMDITLAAEDTVRRIDAIASGSELNAQ